eukprot:5551794-Pleurochrysis_carterae.AAC.2
MDVDSISSALEDNSSPSKSEVQLAQSFYMHLQLHDPGLSAALDGKRLCLNAVVKLVLPHLRYWAARMGEMSTATCAVCCETPHVLVLFAANFKRL